MGYQFMALAVQKEGEDPQFLSSRPPICNLSKIQREIALVILVKKFKRLFKSSRVKIYLILPCDSLTINILQFLSQSITIADLTL